MTATDLLLAELRQEREDLTRRLADTDELMRLLARRARQSPQSPDAADGAPDDEAPVNTTGAAQPGVQQDEVQPNNNRALVLSVFNDHAGRALRIEEVLTEMQAREWRTSSLNPRGFLSNLLSRMANEGTVTRAGHGAYKLGDVNTQTTVRKDEDPSPFEDGDPLVWRNLAP